MCEEVHAAPHDCHSIAFERSAVYLMHVFEFRAFCCVVFHGVVCVWLKIPVQSVTMPAWSFLHFFNTSETSSPINAFPHMVSWHGYFFV